MKYLSQSVAVGIIVVTLVTELIAADDNIPKCLYGTFTQGDQKTPVEPCVGDIKNIKMDPAVLAVLRIFNIPRNTVVFSACPGGRFSAMPADADDGKRFVVRYPSAVQSDYLAPIVHELGHVLQMRSAGGLAALNPEINSRRIELGADFLAGLAFNLSLQNLNKGDFETNLELVGSYILKRDDHGTPEDRTVAFRLGAYRKDPYPELTIVEALNYWNLNDYPRLRR